MRFSVRRKIFFYLAGLIFLGCVVGMSLGYRWGYRLIKDTSITYQGDIAEAQAVAVGELVQKTLAIIRSLTYGPGVQDIIEGANGKRSEFSTDDLNKYFADMDLKWAKASKDDPLVLEYTANRFGDFFNHVTLTTPKNSVAEIFVTDKYGGLVAASDKTTDFYQADETWWQRAFDGGRGSEFIGDIELDESSGAVGFTYAVPVRSPSDKVIGVMKSIVRLNALLSSISDFAARNNCRMTIINEKNDIILHSRLGVVSGKYLTERSFARLLKEESLWFIQKAPFGESGDPVLVVLAKIPNRLFEANGIRWWLAVETDAVRVFRSLREYMTQGAVLAVSLLLLLLPMAYFISGVLSKPINALRAAAEHITSDSKTLPLELHTSDEIEDLAAAFNGVLARLHRAMVSREELLAEIDERLRAEARLKESQADLIKKTDEVNAALVEVVKSRSVVLGMLDENKRIRKELEAKVSELEGAQNMLIHSEKIAALGRLIVDMVHEISNPLAVISGNAQLALSAGVSREEMVSNVEAILKESTAASAVIRRFLKLSRPVLSEIQEADINEFLSEIIAVLERQFLLVGIAIKKSYGQAIPPVRIDRQQMEEVFLNLFMNARDAMPEGGSVEVRTSRQDGFVRVDIKDTGGGMPKDSMKRLFEPFFTTKSGGSGLGLAISYNIVTAHKGKILCASAPGEGTTFSVILPL